MKINKNIWNIILDKVALNSWKNRIGNICKEFNKYYYCNIFEILEYNTIINLYVLDSGSTGTRVAYIHVCSECINMDLIIKDKYLRYKKKGSYRGGYRAPNKNIKNKISTIKCEMCGINDIINVMI